MKDQAPPFPPCWLPAPKMQRAGGEGPTGRARGPCPPWAQAGPLAPTESPQSGACLGLWSPFPTAPTAPRPKFPVLVSQEPPPRPPRVALRGACSSCGQGSLPRFPGQQLG